MTGRSAHSAAFPNWTPAFAGEAILIRLFDSEKRRSG